MIFRFIRDLIKLYFSNPKFNEYKSDKYKHFNSAKEMQKENYIGFYEISGRNGYSINNNLRFFYDYHSREFCYAVNNEKEVTKDEFKLLLKGDK